MNIEALDAATDFFTETQNKLRAAETDGDLTACVEAIDSLDFGKLPPGAQEELRAQYRHQCFLITGALQG